MRATEIAWAAGFFDGEGCTAVSTRKPTNERPRGRFKQLFLVVTQCGPDAPFLLARFQAAVGGCGSIQSTYPASEHRLAKYRWQIGSLDTARTVMRVLWQYLGPAKRRQFITAYRTVRRHRCKVRRENWARRITT